MLKKWDAISLGIFLISAFVITDLIIGEAPETPPICREGYEYEASTGLCLLIITDSGDDNIPLTCPDGYVAEQESCVRVITKTETTPSPIITEGCPEGEYIDDFGSCKPIIQGEGTGGGGGALYMSFIPSDTKGLSILFVIIVFMVSNWYLWGRKIFSRGR